MTRPKLPPAAATTAASVALIILQSVFAAGCRTPAPADTQAADAATARRSSLAPAPNNAPPASQTASPGKVESPLPAPAGFVNDYAKVIDEATRGRLEERLRLLKERGKVEFAVATVETTGERDTDDYSLAVARGWGLGSKETGDGLLLLVAVKDRRWRVQVSRSLEAALPDEAVAETCRRGEPLYREGRYGEGVAACVDGLVALLAEKKGFRLEE